MSYHSQVLLCLFNEPAMPVLKNLLLKGVDELQAEALRHFINFHDWNIEVEEVAQPAEGEAGGAQANIVVMPSQPNQGNGYKEDEPNNLPLHQGDLLEDPDEVECPHCYLRPCAITHRQGWLEKAQPPKLSNRNIRKKMYKKFWSVMDHRGAWREPRYTRKKYNEMRREIPDDDLVWENAVGNHQREIMPDCVLKFVRGMYPNPAEYAYMGHRWQ